jgi:hypothetical protein
MVVTSRALFRRTPGSHRKNCPLERGARVHAQLRVDMGIASASTTRQGPAGAWVRGKQEREGEHHAEKFRS